MTDTARHRHRFLALAWAPPILLLLASACSSDDDPGSASSSETTAAQETTTTAAAQPTALDVTSTDYAYSLATDTVPAGLVSVTQHNEGEEAHQVTLIKLDDGQTADQLATALGEQGDTAAAPEAFAGGPNSTAPGDEDTATVDLQEGNYALICFIPSSDGESHFQKGMVGELTVDPAEGPAAAPPETDGTIHMADFTYTVPDDFTGQGTYEVVNDGPQVHELTISTATDNGDGGLAAIAPGATAYVDLDLAPADYNFTCFVSDADTGAPHFTLGMNVPVTIGGAGGDGGGGGGGSSGATTTTG